MAFLRQRRYATGAVLLIAAIALVAAWTAYQPVRSMYASDAAFETLKANGYGALAK